jgi:hypothetical protein
MKAKTVAKSGFGDRGDQTRTYEAVNQAHNHASDQEAVAPSTAVPRKVVRVHKRRSARDVVTSGSRHGGVLPWTRGIRFFKSREDYVEPDANITAAWRILRALV